MLTQPLFSLFDFVMILAFPLAILVANVGMYLFYPPSRKKTKNRGHRCDDCPFD